MTDAAGRFRGKLEELCAQARRSGMRLTVGQVHSAFKEEHLTCDQFQLIYNWLDEMAIEIIDPQLAQTSSGQERKGTLELYLEEVDRFAPLPEETEYLLFEKAAGGDREAADTLIERYLACVCDLASEFEKTHPKVEAEDLVQEANIGLVMGVAELKKENSLASYRVKLLNYVTSFLEERVKSLEEAANSDQRIVNRMNQLADTIRELEQQLGHKPSIDELSVFLDLPEEDIRDLLRLFPEE